jgi:hypothetical protein
MCLDAAPAVSMAAAHDDGVEQQVVAERTVQSLLELLHFEALGLHALLSSKFVDLPLQQGD